MRKIFIILLCLLSIQLSATIYYVSPTGNDASADPTNIATPWRTWNYAFNHTTSSDTCYFRGGVYTGMYSASYGVLVNSASMNGTYSNPTCFFAYPADWAAGNYPVLDCQSLTTLSASNLCVGILVSHCSNIYFKGLTVRNVPQVSNIYTSQGWLFFSWGSSEIYIPNNIRFENCVAHNTGGGGFSMSETDTTYFINCDVYNCCDSLTCVSGGYCDPGGDGTGFGIFGVRPNAYTYMKGCRAWQCSDQGWAVSRAGTTVLDSCWSIHNGDMPFAENLVTKGSGFKVSYVNNSQRNLSRTQLIMHNCIAAYNEHIGINWTDQGESEMPEIRAHIYNNFIYGNHYDVGKPGGHFGWGIGDFDAHTDTTNRWDHWYWNNISYNNLGYPDADPGDAIAGIHNEATNKFDVIGTTISNSDFESLDTAGMLGNRSRQADFSLPVTTFGHLSEGSECINAGTDVGLDYIGDAPDIGWFEYDSEEDPPPTTPLISTTIPTHINVRTSISGGTVTSDGGAAVTERGICWSTSANPTTSNSKITSGTGEGAFTITITGLLSNTTYHVRAYAINSEGTSYGADEDFTTPKWTSAKYGVGLVVNSSGKIIVIK